VTVAILTGGSGGLGLAVAHRLVEAGFSLGFCYHREENWAKEILTPHDRSYAASIDVRKPNTVSSAFKSFYDRLGSFDYVITCHGITMDARIEWMTEREWRAVLDVNLTGNFNVLQAALPFLNSPAHIAIVSSALQDRGVHGAANYAASKSGLLGLVRSAASEFAERGVRVNLIAPGYFQAGMGARLSEKLRSRALTRIPLGRFGDPKEFAEFVLKVMETPYTTGQVFTVDGGVSWA